MRNSPPDFAGLLFESLNKRINDLVTVELQIPASRCPKLIEVSAKLL